MRRSIVAGVVAAVVLASGPAWAQGADDKAAAEVLFQSGKSLLAEGKYAEACPKLAESLKLDVGVGTMLYLAECYERLGKTASAWAQFREAQEAAKKENDAQRTRIAKDRADKLEPKLSRMAVLVGGETPGLVVTKDGTPVGPAVWGVETPVDPGDHVVRATAPERQPWEGTVRVVGAGAHERITVPELPLAPKKKVETPESPPPPPAREEGGSSQRTIAVGVGVLGVVGVGVGGYFGLKAMSTLSDADKQCTSSACTQQGLDLRSDSRSQATISTIGFIAGGVALAGAVALWLTAPPGASAQTTQARSIVFAPSPLPGGAGLAAAARF